MDDFIVFLGELSGEYERDRMRLESEQRRDEADLKKISRNICTICRKEYEKLAAELSGTPLKSAYLMRLRGLEETWTEAEQKAKEHRDAIKMLPEVTKLRTLDRIRLRYLAMGRKLP